MLLVDGYQALLQPWDIRARREVPECDVPNHISWMGGMRLHNCRVSRQASGIGFPTPPEKKRCYVKAWGNSEMGCSNALCPYRNPLAFGY